MAFLHLLTHIHPHMGGDFFFNPFIDKIKFHLVATLLKLTPPFSLTLLNLKYSKIFKLNATYHIVIHGAV